MRYADSTGSDEDHRYPHAWRYRDYVVQAFNDDMPYNQFVREQLAGDILAADPNSGVGYRGIVATGFLALGKKALAQKDLPLKRYDVVDDQIEVTAKAFLGLTSIARAATIINSTPSRPKTTIRWPRSSPPRSATRRARTATPSRPRWLPPGEFEAFKKQWSAYNELAKEGVGDHRLRPGRQEVSRHGRETDRRVDAGCVPRLWQGRSVRRGGRGNQTGEKQLARWVDYLKDEQRPELAKWRAATDANRKDVAAQYQEEFHRGAYQYDQDHELVETSADQLSQCRQGRRSASEV